MATQRNATTIRHGHWEGIGVDELGESHWFGEAHEAIIATPFDRARAADALHELAELARNKGYADEDSHLSRSPSDDADLEAAMQESHDRDPDAQWTHEFETSFGLLLDAVATDEARTFAFDLAVAMRDARLEGAAMRRRQEDAPEASAAP